MNQQVDIWNTNRDQAAKFRDLQQHVIDQLEQFQIGTLEQPLPNWKPSPVLPEH